MPVIHHIDTINYPASVKDFLSIILFKKVKIPNTLLFNNYLFFKFILKWGLTNVTRLVATSKYIKNILQGITPGLDVKIIPPGIYIPDLAADTFMPIKPTVAYFGALTIWRGPLDVINAFSQIIKENHNVRLMIASPQDDYITKYYCEKIIKNLGLNSNVMWKGFCNDIYQEILMPSTVICLPFRQSVLDPPLTVLEAMSAGKPVITTKINGIREFIEDGKTGFLIEVRDIEKLTEKIKVILKYPELAQEIGKKARKKFKQHAVGT